MKLHERLIAKHGLPLDALSAAYARKAADAGTTGPWWRVWRAIERARGHRLRAAIATLNPSDRRWFALWSFARGRLKEGIVAYRAYLADPGGIGPFDKESAEFLRHVVTVKGPLAALEEPLLASPQVAAIRLSLLIAHRPAELLTFAPPPSLAHDGAGWARHAIALAKNGRDAAPALDRAAKLGLRGGGKELEALMLDVFPDWKPWPYPEGDFKERWRANPGARVAPANGESRHAFGGADFELPACKGCGHPEHQFFVFDVASIPDLQKRIPAWAKLPLIGCVDCALWLVRRDYRIGDSRIDTLGVGAEGPNLEGLSKAYNTLGPIARQPVDVVAVAGEDIGSDRTQVGGEPDWVQDVERSFCPSCWNEQAFVAAHGSTNEKWLEPEFTVNNGSGNQYYFACNPCKILSVFGQNT